MKITEAKKLHDDITQRMWTIRGAKAHDYAGDKDVFTNFRTTSGILKVLKENGMELDVTTPEGEALHYLVHKFCRICNILRKPGQPMNEPLDDSFLDGMNYFEIARELILEREQIQAGMEMLGNAN